MSTLLKKARALATSATTVDKQKGQQKSKTQKSERFMMPQVVATSYTSLPVDVPESFLAPLEDPSQISVKKIDFATSAIPEYRRLYAVVLDNVLSKEECDQLIHLAEQSAGAHREGMVAEGDNGWKQAMINAGPGKEYSMLDYRNSDRIIWDHHEIANRLWERCFQTEEIKKELTRLNAPSGDDRHYDAVLGPRKGRSWNVVGLNERLRFLRYGAGMFFREHCDGQYGTDDGLQTSFYTFHLYMNDSLQTLQAEGSKETSVDSFDRPVCVGGATTFHSAMSDRTIDIDPKIGRVLIFQQNRLLHSGADVHAGLKYTLRSDVMFKFEA